MKELIRFKKNEKIGKKENDIFTFAFRVYFQIFLIVMVISIFVGNGYRLLEEQDITLAIKPLSKNVPEKMLR